MTQDRLTEAAMTESLDARGLLAASHGPGCYALQLAVPDSLDAVQTRWDDHHDARPAEGHLERLAAAERVAYVGASKDVYGRLGDHTAGDVRQTAICEVFPPTRVVDVWPHDDPFVAEHKRALKLARGDTWTVWCNGEVLG